MLNNRYYTHESISKSMTSLYSELGRNNNLSCGGVYIIDTTKDKILLIRYFADSYDKGTITEINRSMKFRNETNYDEMLNELYKREDTFIVI